MRILSKETKRKEKILITKIRRIRPLRKRRVERKVTRKKQINMCTKYVTNFRYNENPPNHVYVEGRGRFLSSGLLVLLMIH